jgi:hypothetical protein
LGAAPSFLPPPAHTPQAINAATNNASNFFIRYSLQQTFRGNCPLYEYQYITKKVTVQGGRSEFFRKMAIDKKNQKRYHHDYGY